MERTCPECGDPFTGPPTKTYCSRGCKERRSRRDRHRTRHGLPVDAPVGSLPCGPRPRGRRCDVDGCSEPHAAHGYCRRHYNADRRHRGIDTGRTDTRVIVGALAKRYDDTGEFIEDPWPTRITVRPSATIVVPVCPLCRNTMYRITHPTLDLRDCGTCHLRVMLNSDEVEAVIPSPRPQDPTRRGGASASPQPHRPVHSAGSSASPPGPSDRGSRARLKEHPDV